MDPDSRPAARVSGSRPKTQYTQAQDSFFSAFDTLGSVSAAAREAGININTCFQWLYKAGIRPKQRAVDRPAEFERLRTAGRTQREAALAVRIHLRTVQDWDTGVRRTGNKRVYPDGRIIDYKQGVTTFTSPATAAPTLSPGLAQLQNPISSRYLSLPEREQIRDLAAVHRSGLGRPGLDH